MGVFMVWGKPMRPCKYASRVLQTAALIFYAPSARQTNGSFGLEFVGSAARTF